MYKMYNKRKSCVKWHPLYNIICNLSLRINTLLSLEDVGFYFRREIFSNFSAIIRHFESELKYSQNLSLLKNTN